MGTRAPAGNLALMIPVAVVAADPKSRRTRRRRPGSRRRNSLAEFRGDLDLFRESQKGRRPGGNSHPRGIRYRGHRAGQIQADRRKGCSALDTDCSITRPVVVWPEEHRGGANQDGKVGIASWYNKGGNNDDDCLPWDVLKHWKATCACRRISRLDFGSTEETAPSVGMKFG